MTNEEILNKINGGLIVSCQALESEPLYDSYIMSKMAWAAKLGGAVGIRANTVVDIKAIKEKVDLPIIGIIKQEYDDSDVYITPTYEDVDHLVQVGCDIIAMDATISTRPGCISLDAFFKKVKENHPKQLFMADCSTVEEAVHADELGFDFIGTTLVGYTNQSKGNQINADDFKIIRDILKKVKHPVIAEGNIDTPQKAKRVLELGCYSVVVGSIITRPQLITKSFVEEMEKDN